MVYWRKRGALPEKAPMIIAALVGMVVILFIYIAAKGAFNIGFVTTTSCWLSNGVKCGGGAMTFMPNLCTFEVVEEPVDNYELAELLRDTYWMYHRSKCDFTNTGQNVFLVFSFSPKEELSVEEFIVHLTKYNRGDPVEDLAFSDFNYIEENTIGNTICFDDGSDSLLLDHTFSPEEEYFIYYYDNQKQKEEDDKIIVTSNPNYDIFKVGDIIFPEQEGGFLQKAWGGKWEAAKNYGTYLGLLLFPPAGLAYGAHQGVKGVNLAISEARTTDNPKSNCIVYGVLPQSEFE